MITRNLLSCCMYCPSIGTNNNNYNAGGGVINFRCNKVAPRTYGIRSDMYNQYVLNAGGTTPSYMNICLARTGKALEEFTEQEIYNPSTAPYRYYAINVSSNVVGIKQEGASVYTGLQYTFVVQNTATTANIENIDTIYVYTAITSSPNESEQYVTSIHKLGTPITLAPQDTYQFKVSYDNLVIDVPSTIASA